MRYLVMIVTMLVLGCSGPTEPECDICTTSAIVYGSVQNASGQSAAGMPLDIRIFADECPGAMPRGGSDTQVNRTDSAGNYRAVILSLWGPFTARCLVITSNPDSLPQWPTDRIERSVELGLRADHGNEPRDSIRFDLQLPAS